MSTESNPYTKKPSSRRLRLAEREEHEDRNFTPPDDDRRDWGDYDGPSTVAGYFETQGLRMPGGV